MRCSPHLRFSILHSLVGIGAIIATSGCGETPGTQQSNAIPLETPKALRTSAPPDLRAEYIRSVQEGAGEAYFAGESSPRKIRLDNPAHRFETTVTSRGLAIAAHEGNWGMSARATSFGCVDNERALAEGKEQFVRNRVTLDRPEFKEWLFNGPLGLEQGFDVARSPNCVGPKVIRLEVTGDLHPALGDLDAAGHGKSVRLEDSAGQQVLSYADLYVKDANGKSLPAWFGVDRGSIAIHFDDAGATYPVVVDPLWAQQAKLIASDGAAEDWAGWSVDISGDTAIMGSFYDDIGANADQGSAYVFVRNGSSWSQQAKLVANDGAATDLFGISVAIDGNTAVVGACNADVAGFTNRGAAYVFVRNGVSWSQQAKLTTTESNNVGVSVAIEGDTALLGSSMHHFGWSASGPSAAYVFVRNGTNWSQQAKLQASDGGTSFGGNVALSGNTALIGKPFENNLQGSAYFFVRSGVTWTEQAKILASDGAVSDEFGRAVDIDGDTAIIGAFSDSWGIYSDAGSAYIFTRSGNAWTQQTKLTASDASDNDSYGLSVAIEGTTALVGAYGWFNSNGAMYVYKNNAGTWSEQEKIVASDTMGSDYMAISVALSGNTAVTGAYGDDNGATSNQGSAYVFTFVGSANGIACATAGNCASGFCVDGVCCNSACGNGATNDCQACSTAQGAAISGTCSPIAAGTMCRASLGGCDPAETCNGTNLACPADAKSPMGTECRASAGACDIAESCDGANADCPVDAKVSAGTMCRVAAGDCDIAESCDGANADCPVDAKVSAGTMCRVAAGDCDIAESCDGANADCPVDAKISAGTTCRAAAGDCDIAESCDGANAACPMDAKVSAGTTCRVAAGDCDIAESCDGSNNACPADGFVAAKTECRLAQGPCDLAETCTGKDANCPPDAVANVATDCRMAAGPCDIPEKCDGVSKGCTPDQLAPPGAPCRPAANECDAVETCSGITSICPSDGHVPDGTACSQGMCVQGMCFVEMGGAGGMGGTAGAGGSAGAGGTAGSGGTGGMAGAGGSGGMAGAGGIAGAGGSAGAAGAGGEAGKGGSGETGGSGTGASGSNDPGSDGACDCRAAGNSPSQTRGGLLTMLGLSVLAWRRRNNRRSSS